MRHITAQRWLLTLAIGLAGCGRAPAAPTDGAPVRIGHFPNVTHLHALVGRQQHAFEDAVGGPIQWQTFNAGPNAMEALLAGALDFAYVGPNPAVNVYLRSRGEAVRIVSGATSGGAALVVREGAAIHAVQDFHGKRVASPEIGNTQDVALRYWLIAQQLPTTREGGDVEVIPVHNADILALFQRDNLDAAWVPEPWATRLIHEGRGALWLDERDLWPGRQFPTVVLVVRTAFLRQQPDVVARVVAAHRQLTRWMLAHPDETRTVVNNALGELLGKPLPDDVLAEAMTRLAPTNDPMPAAITSMAERAAALGYLPATAASLDLSGLVEVPHEDSAP